MAGDEQRLVQRPAHQAGGAHAIGQARHVDHVGHLLEAAADLADQVGAGAFQADLAAGHGAAAQLVLQADDAVGVARTVLAKLRQEEQGHALHAFRRALGAGEDHRQVGVRVGAEPLVAIQLPLAALLPRHGTGSRHVGAGGLLGHEHGALEQLVEIPRGQGRQVAFDQFRGAEPAQGTGQRVGHADRAAEAELGCTNRWVSVYFTSGGGPSGRWLMAARPSSA
ncbi:Uncharacterised protein [Pseudomonas aeruginosa]|nr:Uncharacterised protein [Pseudomonas aeruginosa]